MEHYNLKIANAFAKTEKSFEIERYVPWRSVSLKNLAGTFILVQYRLF